MFSKSKAPSGKSKAPNKSGWTPIDDDDAVDLPEELEGLNIKSMYGKSAIAADGPSGRTISAGSMSGKSSSGKSIPAKSISTKSTPAKSIPATSVPANSIPAKSISAKSISAKSTPAKSIPATSIPANSIPAKSISAKSIPAKSISSKTVSGKTQVGVGQSKAPSMSIPVKTQYGQSRIFTDNTVAPKSKFEMIPEDDESEFVIPAKSFHTTAYDIEMATRQSRYEDLDPKEKKVQDKWAIDQLSKHANCPEKFAWVRRDAENEEDEGGFQCLKGGHSMTDRLIAEGLGGVFAHPGKQWGIKHGPWYPHPTAENMYARGDDFVEIGCKADARGRSVE